MRRPAELDVERVRYETGGTLILDDVDCTAPAGGITGVLGPNGSGKSTLLRLIASAAPPSAGTLRLAGEDLRRSSRRQRAREIAFVEQETHTEVSLRVLDAVLLGRTPHRSGWGADTAADRGLARDCLARVDASDLEQRDFDTLSGGERQKVQLARALAQEPQLLLLDEPSNHLDIAAQLALLAQVRTLAGEGVTVLMALHDLNQALSTCDHAILLASGKVVAAGRPCDVLTPDRIADVYGVQAHVLESDGVPVLQFRSLPTGSPSHGRAAMASTSNR